MFSTIFSVVFLLAAALAILFGALKAKKRTTLNSIARMIIVVISAILATFLSSLASFGLGNIAFSSIPGLLGDEATALINELPSLPDTVAALVATILAPTIFLTVFLIIKAILNKLLAGALVRLIEMIVRKIKKNKAAAKASSEQAADEKAIAEEEISAEISSDETVDDEVIVNEEAVEQIEETKKDKKKKKKEEKFSRKATATSIICSAICSFLVLIVTLIPYVGSLKLAGEIGTSVTNDDDGIVAEISDAAVNNIGTKTVSALGGDLIYSALTTYKINGEKATFVKDAKFIVTLCDALTANDLAPEQKAAKIREASKAVDDATIIPTLASELVNAANASWQNGEKFHGIALPAIGGDTEIMSSITGCMSNSTRETMKNDIKTIVNVVAVIVENDALSSLKGEDAVNDLLSNEKLIMGISVEILANERLSPVLGEITNYSMTLIAKTLNVYENSDDAYDSFIDDIIEAGTTRTMSASSSDEIEKLAEKLDGVFDGYGIELSDDDLVNITTEINDSFKDPGNITKKNVKSILSSYSALTFKSADEFTERCNIVTADKIKVANNKIDNVDDEARTFSKICASLSLMLKDIKKDSSNIAAMVKDFGPLLDSFASSKIIGSDVAKNLLTASLQSKTVRNSLGMTLKGATDVANSISDSSTKDSYSVLMLSLSNTINVLEKTSNKQNSTEEITTLIKDMTPESAKTLQQLAKPEVIQNYGVPEKNAEPVSNLMSDIFGNMSDAKSNPDKPMSDEQYQKESQAINDMMNIAMNSTSNSSSDTLFGENGSTGITASEYVDRVLDSEIMSETLVQNVYTDNSAAPKIDPLEIGKELTDAEKTELTTALTDKWNDQKANSTDAEANAEYQKVLTSIAAIVNLPITFN